jgi:PAS domain S-box-containing protein
MNSAEFQLRGVDDARLAIHATSPLPAWLWSADGARVLWANPVGAVLLGATNSAALAARSFGPADPQRRQVAQLATRLLPNAGPRLERLRGFGAPLGSLVTCACTRLAFSDGDGGILIVAAARLGRPMPLVERLQRLVDDADTPIAAFARDGMFVSASKAARPLLGFRNLSEAGLDTARNDALRDGRVETPIGIGHVVLQRVGCGTDTALIALIAPGSQYLAPYSAVAIAPYEVAPEPVAATPMAPIEPADSIPAEPLPPSPADTNAPPTSNDAAPLADAPVAEPDIESEELLFDAFGDATESLSGEAASEVPPHGAVSSPPSPISEPHEAFKAPDVVAAATPPTPDAGKPDAAPPTPDIRVPPAPLEPPRHPLRFMWQMDAEGRFALGSDEFIRLIGAHTATAFGRPWHEIAELFALDPQGLVAKAVATRDTWSGITLQWPVDDPNRRLPVELSGLPVYDRTRTFIGYRGFGVCRDLDALAELARRQHQHLFDHIIAPRPLAADVPHDDATPAEFADTLSSPAEHHAAAEPPSSPRTEPDHLLENSQNVVPFRPTSETKSPALTPVENSAFNELARQLSARLEHDNAGGAMAPADDITATDDSLAASALEAEHEQPDWLPAPTVPPRGETARDRLLLDLVPAGILIYRLEQLLYANRAFLQRMGYDSLDALSEAGGLDALYIEPGMSVANNAPDTGTPVTITTPSTPGQAAPPPAAARLHGIEWDGEAALALICSDTDAIQQVAAPTVAAAAPSSVGHANAEELGAILDTTAEGVVMFDGAGQISACNRSAEALFGHDGDELVRHNLTDLFAPESQPTVRDYHESIKGAGVASLLDHGREALGRVREGGFIPLAMTMGRTGSDSPNFFAVFRDMSQSKQNEAALVLARRQIERAATAKADVLARVSHEIRTPLNAIIGFAEVMIDERLGALGNERYVEYMKDIRASGERVGAIVDEMLDLSRIETGKLDLAFTRHNLNDLLEQCVAVLQPRANRERIIIRSSLAHTLPAIVADARTLRQIALNLISNSIHLANAGGHVIVSTALSDASDVVLRVRDTGHALNDSELAAAIEPFGTPTPDQTPSHAGVSLALTKALVEANGARFQIKNAPHSGTLIEVMFAPAEVQA